MRLRKRDGGHTVTSMYTNNMTRMSLSLEELRLAELGERFKVRDMGDIHFVLGI